MHCFFFCYQISGIDDSRTAEPDAFRIEYLMINTIARHTQPIILTSYRLEVAHANQFITVFGNPAKRDQAPCAVIESDPLKSLPTEVVLVQCRMFQIEMIDFLKKAIDLLMTVILKQIPLYALVIVPFVPLSDLAPHKHQFFTGMGDHIIPLYTISVYRNNTFREIRGSHFETSSLH